MSNASGFSSSSRGKPGTGHANCALPPGLIRAHASCRSFCIVAESCATTVRSPAMRNWSLVSGMYHANSPAELARISSTLPLRRSVTMVMSAESPRNPR